MSNGKPPVGPGLIVLAVLIVGAYLSGAVDLGSASLPTSPIESVTR